MGTPHHPVSKYFWNKEEWKTEVHDSHSGKPQLFVQFLLSDHRLRHLFLCYDPQCSPHTCSQYNLPLGGIIYSPIATQAQPALHKQEGEQVTLDCSYETSKSFYQLYWYKQAPSGEMIFLIRQISSSHHNESSGRYSVIFQKSAKFITLIISASQVEDSMNYFCALGEPAHSV
ncbi:T cell receptor alpha variable 14/delta variable 4 [Lemmus lemmus]